MVGKLQAKGGNKKWICSALFPILCLEQAEVRPAKGMMFSNAAQ